MADGDVDLFVIGGGSGGVRAARVAAGHGARVMIAEEYRVGGTCVIRGCVPKKLLVYASRFAHEFEDAASFGWSVPDISFDWPTLIANKDREIARLETAYTANLENAGVRIAKTRAVLDDPHTVRLTASGERVSAGHVLIATGGTPHPGDAIPGIEHGISSNEAFHLAELPKCVLIQGGGYIAVEFACIFAGLGAEVILVYRGQNILRGFDDDVRAHLREEMERRGIDVRCGLTVTGVEKTPLGYAAHLSDHTSVMVDKVMFATGRRPNTAGMGLERVGVTIAEKGGSITVDKFSQTTVPHIYAVGDVTNRVNLTPVAIREGHAFADTVFGNRPTAVDHADLGLTEAQALARLPAVDVFKTSFRPLKVTLSGRNTRALMKLVVDATTDRVVGCHIVGPDAAEMIQMIGIVITMGGTKADFDATMALHPTGAEELVTLHTPTARHRREAAE